MDFGWEHTMQHLQYKHDVHLDKNDKRSTQKQHI